MRWPIRKLGEICEIIAGQAPPSKHYNNKGNGVPFLTVNSFGVVYPKVERWTTKCLRESKEGDVLFSVAGSLGSVNLGINACITRSIFALRPLKEAVLQKFLYYSLKKYGTEIASMGSGTAQRVINIKQISEFQIPLPPLPIQQKIVKILDTVQEAVEVQDKIIEKTKELKKSLMADLFKYGGPSFRKGRKLKKTEIGEIPENWEVVRLGEVVKLSNGIRPEFDDEGFFPVYGANGIMGKSRNFLIDDDYILIIGRVGASGEVHLASGKIWVSDNALYSEKVKREKIYLPFLKEYLTWRNLKQFADRSTHPIITQTFLKTLTISLPPLPEQQEIAEILQTLDQKIEIEQKKKELYEELFKTLLNKIMNQEIDVDSLDVSEL